MRLWGAMRTKNSNSIGWPRVFLAIALLLSCVWFIWSNSFLDSYASALRSQAVADFLARVMGGWLGPQSPIVRFMVRNVRKVAHAVEFCVLGLVSGMMLMLLRRATGHMVLHAVLLVLFVAVADESIQIFTGRGAQVQDILLDFSAGIAGLFFVLLVCGLLIRMGRAMRADS